MGLSIRVTGRINGISERILGRIVHEGVPDKARPDCLFAVCAGMNVGLSTLRGYGAVLFEQADPTGMGEVRHQRVVTGVEGLSALEVGTVLALSPRSKSVHVLYRPRSEHNALFVTERCNSRCIMCSQPPLDLDEADPLDEQVRAVGLIANGPSWIGITGGEPTLLGSGLIRLVRAIGEHLPQTRVQMLTNGRLLAESEYADSLAGALPRGSLVAIPLHCDDAPTHDFIAQARGAFNETVRGIYNLAHRGVSPEIRVILQKASIPRLLDTCEFIYRNMPFVQHVALMGIEPMGYVKRNWEDVWIDPMDYGEDLERAVHFLHRRRVPVSIFNLPHCVLPQSLWSFARKSISDHKNVYVEACVECVERGRCGGLFESATRRYSRGIAPIGGRVTSA